METVEFHPRLNSLLTVIVIAADHPSHLGPISQGTPLPLPPFYKFPLNILDNLCHHTAVTVEVGSLQSRGVTL